MPPACVQILDMMGAGGAQLAEIAGSSRSICVEQVQVERDARLVGDGRQVQHRVRGAAQGHVHGEGVLEGGSVAMSRGRMFFFSSSMIFMPASLARRMPGRVNGRDGAVARQPQSRAPR